MKLQKQGNADSLVHKILNSKCLLKNHSLVLQQCMLPNNQICENSSKPFKFFTACNACLLLGSTLLAHWITPKSMRLTVKASLVLTASFGVLYVVKNFFVCCDKRVENKLNDLVGTMEDFSNCIRCNISFFDEVAKLDDTDLMQYFVFGRELNCMFAVKEVTEMLFDVTRTLEIQYPLNAKYEHYYSPMEELDPSEYFKLDLKYNSAGDIKNSNNFLTSVQSQFLLRLALTMLTKPSIGRLLLDLSKLECFISKMLREEKCQLKEL